MVSSYGDISKYDLKHDPNLFLFYIANFCCSRQITNIQVFHSRHHVNKFGVPISTFWAGRRTFSVVVSDIFYISLRHKWDFSPDLSRFRVDLILSYRFSEKWLIYSEKL